MRLLHTSDWHVGKQIRGRSRLDEHREVLAEIVKAAEDNNVDVTLVAGDLFETAAPTGEQEKLVYETLLALAEVSPLCVVSGNHDNARRLRAIAPVMSYARINLVTEPTAPDAGGVVDIETESGEVAKVAMLPFVSQRAIVKSEQLVGNQAFQNSQTYAQRLSQVVGAISSGFGPDTVNIVLAHAFVTGAELGGGERAAHIVDEYGIPAQAFEPTTSYVALGHLHRPQQIAGATAIHYCGSPLQMDFGEVAQTKQVNLVNIAPGLPAKTEAVTLSSGRQLIKLTGNKDTTVSAARELADSAWIRIDLDEALAPGEADKIREAIGDSIVDIRASRQENVTQATARRLDGSTPSDLFKNYLEETSPEDTILLDRFNELHEEITAEQTRDAEVLSSRLEALEL